MKKTSILLTIGLVLLALIAGCSNEVVYPQFPTGGFVRQTGDFLTGQSFDSSKFEVVATYLGGGQKVIKGAAVKYIDDTTVIGMDSKDTVEAIVGYDYYGEEVKGTGTVTTYSISRLEVTGPETWTFDSSDKTIPASAFTVKAYYLDGKNSEKSMVLRPDEIDTITYDVAVNAEYLSAATTVDITSNVGGTVSCTYPITIVYETTAPATPIASIDSTSEWTGTKTLLALNYEEMPVPTFDDIDLKVNYVVGDSAQDLDVDPGVVLSWVESGIHTPLTSTNMTDESNKIQLEIAYEGAESAYIDVTPTKALLQLTKTPEKITLVPGTDYGDVDTTGFVVDLYADLNSNNTVDSDEFVTRLSNEDVVFTFVNKNDDTGTAYEATDEVKATDAVFVKAVYLDGAVAYADVCVMGDAAPVESKINNIVVASDFVEPAAQQYDEALVPSLSAIASFDVLDQKDTKIKTITTADFNGRVELSYVDASDKDLTTSFPAGKAKIKVSYTPEGSKTAIVGYTEAFTLATAYADALAIEAEYDEGVGTPVTFTVVTRNDNGIVATLTTGYTILDAEGNDVEADAVTVKGEAQQFSAFAWVDSADGKILVESNVVTVEPGIGYVEMTDASKFTFALKSDAKAYIGEKLNGITADYFEVVADGEGTLEDAFVEHDAKIEITNVIASSKQLIKAADNKVTVEYQYVDKTGAVVPGSKEVEFDGSDWVIDFKASLKGTSVYYPGMTYNKAHFDIQITFASGTVSTNPDHSGFLFDITGNTLVGPAGTPQNVVFEYSYGGKEGEYTVAVTPVADYPASVSATQNKTIWYTNTYDASYFDFEITWASGLEYTEESGLTAPEVAYAFEPATAGTNNTQQDVKITWTCGEKTDSITVKVTPGTAV